MNTDQKLWLLFAYCAGIFTGVFMACVVVMR